MTEAKTNPGEFYRGHNNVTCYLLQSTDCQTQLLAPIDLGAVQKMELQLLKTLFDSEANPQAFDWTTGPTGYLRLQCGLLTGVGLGLDIEPELVIYDVSNPDGVTFRMPAIFMRDKQ